VFHSKSTGSIAWQIIAGTVYYITQKCSVSVEYKYLNYNNLGTSTVFGNTNLGQSLTGVGARFHF
jgi:opacity protein-like surface antigen